MLRVSEKEGGGQKAEVRLVEAHAGFFSLSVVIVEPRKAFECMADTSGCWRSEQDLVREAQAESMEDASHSSRRDGLDASASPESDITPYLRGGIPAWKVPSSSNDSPFRRVAPGDNADLSSHSSPPDLLLPFLAGRQQPSRTLMDALS
jgi:hypothetical protein